VYDRPQITFRGREGYNNKGKPNTILKNKHEENTRDETEEKTTEGTKENLKEKSCNNSTQRLTNKKNTKDNSITIGTTEAMRIRGGEGSEEEDLYFISSDNDEEEEKEKESNNFHNTNKKIESTTTTITEGKGQEDDSTEVSIEEEPTAATKRMKVTKDNIPFGHACDDIAIDNDTPYVRVYCQNVCGIFDREGIGLDSAFKEVKQAGADIFTFNETHGDESNATARRTLRLSKQRSWKDNNEDTHHR
jgi:hypothetical protein